ncbi:MAG TPA: DUF192 domain-containing protein [Actinomycetota bacterium]
MRGLPGILIALVLMSTACDGGSHGATQDGPDHAVVFTSSTGQRSTLQVEVADDDRERAQGLMGVRSLPARSGMAFVFDGTSTGSFWMKDTLLPLSIAFVDEEGTIVGIREMTPCEADPCPTYGVDRGYSMAVEANRGYFAAQDIQIGDMARLEELGDA